MKTNYIPAIVMLSAGFIDCLFAIYQHLSLMEFTRQLLLVLVVFLVLGCVVKIVLDKTMVIMADKEETSEEEEPEPEPEEPSEEEPERMEPDDAE